MTGKKGGSPSGGGQGVSGAAKETCRCPNCGYECVRSFLVPCYAMRCPRCDSPMADL